MILFHQNKNGTFTIKVKGKTVRLGGLSVCNNGAVIIELCDKNEVPVGKFVVCDAEVYKK